MSMLVVDRQDASLRLREGALELRLADQLASKVPARLLEHVVLHPDTQLQAGTLAALAELGVAVTVLGGRGGQRVGFVVGAPSKSALARMEQCRRAADPAYVAHYSRIFVSAKIGSQAGVLQSVVPDRLDLRRPLFASRGQLETLRTQARNATDTARIRGFEGAAAAAYFAAYRQLFAPSLGFEARRRRPPPDPVNAALSLGYTLLLGQAVRACWHSGLDPYAGFLHAPAHGRPSLACDLMEPWRGRVDYWVWRLFRERELRPEHFGSDGAGACLMGKAARARFYALAAPLMATCGKGLRRYTRAFASALAAEGDATLQRADDPMADGDADRSQPRDDDPPGVPAGDAP